MGVEVIGDVEFFVCLIDKLIVVVIGLNGKLIVVILVFEVLKVVGYKVGFGGNIGIVVFDLLL